MSAEQQTKFSQYPTQYLTASGEVTVPTQYFTASGEVTAPTSEAPWSPAGPLSSHHSSPADPQDLGLPDDFDPNPSPTPPSPVLQRAPPAPIVTQPSTSRLIQHDQRRAEPAESQRDLFDSSQEETGDQRDAQDEHGERDEQEEELDIDQPEQEQENDYDDFNDLERRAREYNRDRAEPDDEPEQDEHVFSQASQGDQLKQEIAHDLLEECCKSNCTRQMEVDDVYKHILELRELTAESREMYIMGLLDTTYPRGVKENPNKRFRYSYSALGQDVCREAFMVCHDLGKFELGAITKHLRLNGVSPRVHASTGRLPKHALKFEDTDCVVRFIAGYATTHGREQPSPPGRNASTPPIHLAPDQSKAKLWEMYKIPLKQNGVRFVSLSSFRDIWRKCMPHIRFAPLMDDVCTKCFENQSRRNYAKIQDNQARLLQLEQEDAAHRAWADEEWKFYNANVKAAQAELKAHKELMSGPDGPPAHPPPLTQFHYTFDFAQSIGIPFNHKKPGAGYFKALRKVHLFGVRVDSEPLQYNFCVDEARCIGANGKLTHGCNAVVSMLHHVMGRKVPAKYHDTGAVLQADNCNSQNKNNAVMAYLSWRTLNTRHETIEINFMLPGHTKCQVDGGFGHIKRLYRRSTTDTLEDFVRVVNDSAETNVALSVGWKFYDWIEFFKPNYRAIPNILQYQHFRFERQRYGYVSVKRRLADEWTVLPMLKRAANPTDDQFRRGPQEPIPDGGLEYDRQKYLFEQVRFLIVDRAKKNITCPKYADNIQDTPEDVPPPEHSPEQQLRAVRY